MKKQTISVIIICSIFLATILIRFYGLSDKYLGVDEKFTLRYGNDALRGKLIENAKHDSYPPLFYVLSGIVLAVQNSYFALRLFTVFASILLLFLFFKLVTKVRSKTSATILTFLLAANPMSVIFSQHPRPYILLMVLLVLSLWVGHNIIARNNLRDYVLLGAVYAASLYTHYYTIFFIAPQALYLLWHHRQAKKTKLKYLLLTLLCVAILFIPWLPIFFQQYQFMIAEGNISIDKLKIIAVPYPFYKMAIMADLSSALAKTVPVLIGVAVLINILVLRGIIRWYTRSKKDGGFFGITFLGNILIPLVLGFKIPIYSFRYLSVLLPLYVFYLGFGLEFKSKLLQRILFICILAAWAIVLIYYFSISDLMLWRDEFAV